MEEYSKEAEIEKDRIPKKGTVKFLNFGTPEIFTVIYLKFKQSHQTLRYFVKMVQME